MTSSAFPSQAGAPAAPVVVVGAGIAGLATAYELGRQGLAVRLAEAGPRAGGVILTERIDGFLIDAGPDSLIAQKPAALELCRELGLGDRIQTTLEPRTAFILRGDRLHPLPEASVMGIPTRMLPLATASLFSWTGKLRMGLDLVLPRPGGDSPADESIGAFMRRRFGNEAVEYLAEPLLAGIHSGDVDALSMLKLFPRLIEAERTHRSLILAFRRMRAQPSADGLFRSLPGGIGELVDTLVAALPAGTLETGRAVARIERRPPFHGLTAPYDVVMRDGDRWPAAAVVISTPAHGAAPLLDELAPSVAERCREVPYVSSATVALCYRRSDIAHPLRGSGFVVPKVERQVGIMAASFVSSKWPGRAPEGFAMLRAFLGGARSPALLDRDDAELVALAHGDLARLLGIGAPPVLARLYRWPQSNAQHVVGHLERLAAIERDLADTPGLFVTSSGFRSTGITDCVADGRAVAREVARWLAATGSRPPAEPTPNSQHPTTRPPTPYP